MGEPISNLEASRQEGRHQVEEQRTSILDAAEALFLRNGLERTTMVDIAARAVISKVTLYRYYPNRDVIALEIQARMLKRIAALVDLEGRDLSLASAKQVARAMIRNYEPLRDAYRYIGMFDRHYLDDPSDAALAQWTKNQLISFQWGGAAVDEIVRATPRAVPRDNRLVMVISTVVWFLEKLALRGELTWSDREVSMDVHLRAFEDMITGYIDRLLEERQGVEERG